MALAELGTAAAALPIGLRPPVVGFVTALARLLQERAQGKAALLSRLQVFTFFAQPSEDPALWR